MDLNVSHLRREGKSVIAWGIALLAALLGLCLALPAQAFALPAPERITDWYAEPMKSEVFLMDFDPDTMQFTSHDSRIRFEPDSARSSDEGWVAVYFRDIAAEGETVENAFEVLFPNAGYTVEGDKIDVQCSFDVTLTPVGEHQLNDRVILLEVGPDHYGRGLLCLSASMVAANVKNELKCDVVMSYNLYKAGTDELVQKNCVLVFDDIDSRCSDYGKPDEGVRLIKGFERTQINDPTYIEVSDANTLFMIGPIPEESDSAPECRFAALVTSGQATFAYTGYHCNLFLAQNYYGYPDYKVDEPEKTALVEYAYPGDDLEFRIDEFFPYTSGSETDSARSISVVDELNPNADVAYATGRVERFDKDEDEWVDVTDSWNIHVEGQMLTFDCLDTTHAWGDHRFYVTAPLKTTLDYDALAERDGHLYVDNQATVFVNDASYESNVASIEVLAADLSLSEEVDEYEHGVDDEIEYTITVENTRANSAARNVSVVEATLPEGLELVPESLEIAGAPESGASCEQEGNAVRVSIASLSSDAPATVTFRAKATEDVNGMEVQTTPHATCDNALDADDPDGGALVWINSPHPVIEKVASVESAEVGDTVSYAVTMKNAQAGTVLDAACLDDAIASCMQVEEASLCVIDSEGDEIDVSEGFELTDSGFELQTGRSLVAPGNYYLWDMEHSDEPIEQDAMNPRGETAEQELLVEYEALVQSSTREGVTAENIATLTGKNSPDGAQARASVGILPVEDVPSKGSLIKTGDIPISFAAFGGIIALLAGIMALARRKDRMPR